jgi:uncharacterized protein with NRDE domain
MCLVLVSYKVASEFPLIIAANRDERYSRSTRHADFWKNETGVLAGQDLEHGGTWLGLNKKGQFAAVTNLREGVNTKNRKTSRGLIVSDYLQGNLPAPRYLEYCQAKLTDFDSFNLLLGDISALFFFNSQEKVHRKLSPGTYGVSNGDFDNDWPKIIRAKKALVELIESDQSSDHEAMLAIMCDTYLPKDDFLPDTGIGIEWERRLAPIFIKADEYGTRCSTVLSIDKNNKVSFSERSYDSHGHIDLTKHFEFTIKAE